MEVKWRLFDLFIHDLTGPLSIVSTSTDSLLHKVDRYGPLTDHQKRLLRLVFRETSIGPRIYEEMIEILRSKKEYSRRSNPPIEKTVAEALLDVLEMSIPNAVEGLSQARTRSVPARSEGSRDLR